MAIELQHRLETDLGLTWPMTRFLEGPSILQLADEAVEKKEKGERTLERQSLIFSILSFLITRNRFGSCTV